jgi:hypothetical protein
MSSEPQPNAQEADEPEVATDQAIASCSGDIRALIVANNYLELEVKELMKAVSHAMRVEDFTPIPARSEP